MTELEQIMLQALQDMQQSFKADLDRMQMDFKAESFASERSFKSAVSDLESAYTLREQRWERELAAFEKAQKSLQNIFTQVSAENARLSAQVNSLTAQMETLTKLLNSLSG